MLYRQYLSLLAALVSVISVGCGLGPSAKPLAKDYTLETFQEAARWPNQEPVVLLTTMHLFYATGHTYEGVQYFHSLSEAYPGRALLKSCEATLMAKMAYDVPVLSRISWVNDALKKLDEATTDGSIETLYLKGLVESELPGFLFSRARAAVADLTVVLTRQEELPFEAARSLHLALARAYATLGDEQQAKTHLKSAGLSTVDGPHLLSNNRAISFLSNASVTAEDGYRFVRPRVIELSDKLWIIQGFDFANLIAWETSEGVVLVDTGTTIPTATRAKAALRTVTQKPIHTIIVTHAHWDHVGGLSVFMEPATRIISSSLFEQELQVVNGTPLAFKYFFGTHTQREPYTFKPDHRVAGPVEITIGNLRLRLIPVSGGETTDALIVHDTQRRIAVVGDIFMPYFGAPWASEGSPEQLLDAIDRLQQLAPTTLIHGHDPLTRYFDMRALPGLAPAIEETIQATRRMTFEGLTVAEILRELPLPAGLKNHPQAVLPFIMMREGLIQRVARAHVGYWNADGEGVDPVTLEELAGAIDLVGGQTAGAFIGASKRLLNRGDHVLAARVARLGSLRYPKDTELNEIYGQALDHLRDRNHLINPFKFMIYSEMGGKELQPVGEANKETPITN